MRETDAEYRANECAHYREAIPETAARIKPDGPIASWIFETIRLQNMAEGLLVYELREILGYEDADFDLRFDPYDDSIEFIDTTPDFTLTDEQWNKIAALGFKRCWVVHTDNTEHYYPGGTHKSRIA